MKRLILLLLLPTIASAWNLDNNIDFALYAQNQSNCTQINATQTIMGESVNPVNATLLESFMESPTCDNYIRGVHHWMGLHNPNPTCDRFYTFVHQWWDMWNWRFTECSVDISKTDLTTLLDEYVEKFWIGELYVPKQVIQQPPPIIYEPEEDIITSPTTSTGGGGSFTLPDNILFASTASIPNILFIELAFLLISYYFARRFWTTVEYQQTTGTFSPHPFKNYVISTNRKMYYVFICFIVLNLLFFLGYFLVLPML